MAHGEERTRWKVLGERLVDDSPRLRLSVATVELPDGMVFGQYVMRTPRGAMTVVLDEDTERVLLIWRHRFATDQWLWELPGGYIDLGEDGAAAAAREVEEETGTRDQAWHGTSRGSRRVSMRCSWPTQRGPVASSGQLS